MSELLVQALTMAVAAQAGPPQGVPLQASGDYVANRGQYASEVLYAHASSGGRAFLTRGGVTVACVIEEGAAIYGRNNLVKLGASSAKGVLSVRIAFAGSRESSVIRPGRDRPGKRHYMKSSDPRNWIVDVPTFASVRYDEVYPGVSVVFTGSEALLRFDIEAEESEQIDAVHLKFQGQKQLFVDQGTGDLVLQHGSHELRLTAPRTFTGRGTSRAFVPSRFYIDDDGYARVEVLDAPPGPVVVDPTLVFSSYAGGSGRDIGWAVDYGPQCPEGCPYIAGETLSLDYPTTLGVYQNTSGGNRDAFVTRFLEDGSGVAFSTYLGGDGDDYAYGLRVDGSGRPIVVGATLSPSASVPFPTSTGAYSTALSGASDAFVAQLSADGSQLLYGSYLGAPGIDAAFSVAIDSSGGVWVGGGTTDSQFPVTAGAYQTAFGGVTDGFISRMVLANGGASDLLSSTFLGGSGFDGVSGLAIDALGSVYSSLCTNSANMLPTNGSANSGSDDAFISRMNASLSSLAYGTYFGGDQFDNPTDLSVESNGVIFVSGETTSPVSTFPLQNAVDSVFAGQSEAFALKLNTNTDSVVYATYLGGDGKDAGLGIASDAQGRSYIVGHTDGGTAGVDPFPTTAGAIQAAPNGVLDTFATMLNASGGIRYSTLAGGSLDDEANAVAVNSDFDIIVTGSTESSSFPVTVGAFQTVAGGLNDAFLLKLDLR